MCRTIDAVKMWVLCVAVSVVAVFADTIELRNGTSVANATVVEITEASVKYKVAGREVLYNVAKSEIIQIRYADGTADVFGAPVAPVAPPQGVPGAPVAPAYAPEGQYAPVAPAAPVYTQPTQPAPVYAQPAQPAPVAPMYAQPAQPAPVYAQPAQPAPVYAQPAQPAQSGGTYDESVFHLSYGFGAYGHIGLGGGASMTLAGVLGSQYTVEASISTPFNAGGVYAFFDLFYFEASLGLSTGSGQWQVYVGGDIGDLDDYITEAQFTLLNIGLLGKYPFRIDERKTIFPAIGLDYQLSTGGQYVGGGLGGGGFETWDGKGGRHSPTDFSALHLKLGGGFDYKLNREKRFVRIEVFYGLKFATAAEAQWARMFDDILRDSDLGGRPSGGTILGHGVSVKVAYSFKI